MSKDLFDKEKNEKTRAIAPQDGAGASAPVSGDTPETDFKNASLGGYGAKNNYTSGLSKEAWTQSEKILPWNATPKGRLAIRMFSRGILGAAFFTLGGMYAHRSAGLKGYSPETVDWSKPLHVIAKAVDTVAGKPIKMAVHTISGDAAIAERAVRFRPTAAHFSGGAAGRSLGEEIVGITFDFFSASVGDAWGRDIAGWFDPNVKKSWMDDKGRIKFPETIRSMIESTAKYVFYNGGEDWFAALPYAYFMKGQRSLINRFSPGFQYDFDRALNGGSFKIDKHSNIIGNFNKEGLLDLQSRFVVYNVFTRWFRAGWHQLQNRLEGKPTALYGMPDQQLEQKSLAAHAGNFAKWLTRGTIKAVIYMTPAVPFFWLTRTPQSKYKGMFINPETESVLSVDHKGAAGTVRANSLQYTLPNDRHFTGDTPVYLDRFVGGVSPTGWRHQNDVPNNPMAGIGRFDAYERSFGVIDGTLNTFGKANNWARKKAHHLPGLLGYRLAPDKFRQYKNISNRFVNASIAYTPYMYSKAEFANLWDDGKMDVATERLIDGAIRFNLGEFKAGASEIWHAILQQPLPDPAREAEAQRRITLDKMPADVFEKTKGQMAAEHHKLSWTDRLITGKKPADISKTAPGAMPSEIAASKPLSHAEQEKMREILAGATPPTNAIN